MWEEETAAAAAAESEMGNRAAWTLMMMIRICIGSLTASTAGSTT